MTACTVCTRLTGSSRSVSRVPGAPPRTSTPPTAPLRHRITVQPVRASASCAWPTSIPDTSVIAFLSFMRLITSKKLGYKEKSEFWYFSNATLANHLTEAAGQLEELVPLFFEKMHSHVIQLNV